jgi:hypothetical protein
MGSSESFRLDQNHSTLQIAWNRLLIDILTTLRRQGN